MGEWMDAGSWVSAAASLQCKALPCTVSSVAKTDKVVVLLLSLLPVPATPSLVPFWPWMYALATAAPLQDRPAPAVKVNAQAETSGEEPTVRVPRAIARAAARQSRPTPWRAHMSMLGDKAAPLMQLGAGGDVAALQQAEADGLGGGRVGAVGGISAVAEVLMEDIPVQAGQPDPAGLLLRAKEFGDAGKAELNEFMQRKRTQVWARSC
eukprot:360591-Chlamydomonas_euryale.AAC.26